MSLAVLPRIATTNRGKQASFRHAFAAAGLPEPSFTELTLVEPQADTVAEVAISKLRQAWAQTQAPIMVQDTGFQLPALGGFPGPYARYVIDTLGVEGYCRLVRTMTPAEREGAFIKVTALMTCPTAIWVWESREPGHLIDTPCEPGPHDWSALSRLWVPTGATVPVSRLSLDERAAVVAAHATGPSLREAARDLAEMVLQGAPTPRRAQWVDPTV